MIPALAAAAMLGLLSVGLWLSTVVLVPGVAIALAVLRARPHRDGRP